MKLAFVGQPWNRFAPEGPESSVEIWVEEVSRRLAASCEVLVYGAKKGLRQRSSERDGRLFVHLPRAFDHELRRAAARLGVSSLGNQPLFTSRLYAPCYWRALARDLARRGADVVHVNDFLQVPALLRRRERRAALVLQMHSEWLNLLEARLVRRLLKPVDLVAGCSEHVTQLARQAFPDVRARFAPLRNGVDPQLFTPAPRRPEGPGPRLLFLGRVSPEKGVHDLIEAFAQVAAAHPEARLEIVGEHGASLPREYLVELSPDPRVTALERFYRGAESYFEELQGRVRELGLGGRVEFSGRIAFDEVVRRCQRADLLVNPSLSESFGRSLVEAMACELPVLATRVGGMPEVLADGIGGRLVEPADPEALGRAALELLANPSLRRELGAAGRRRVLETYGWDAVAAECLERYRELCE